MQHFVNGIDTDYVDRDLEVGEIQCARADHGLQECVDPVTGITHSVSIQVPGPMGRPMTMRMWRDNVEPKTPGVCFACWAEEHDQNVHSCELHGPNRKIAGLIGCPICAIDVKERAKRDAHVEKMQEIAKVMTPDPDEPDGGSRPLVTGVVTQAMMRDAIRYRGTR